MRAAGLEEEVRSCPIGAWRRHFPINGEDMCWPLSCAWGGPIGASRRHFPINGEEVYLGFSLMEAEFMQ